MKLKRYFIALLLVYLGLGTIFTVHGCMGAAKAQDIAGEAVAAQTVIDVISTEMKGLRDDLAALSASDPDAQETADMLVALMDEKSLEAKKWMDALASANAALAKAEDGWDILETVVGAAAGFFPPLGIGTLMVRRGRKMFNGVVDSMAAGEIAGGMTDDQKIAVRNAMGMIPGLKQMVTDRRVEIGDKVMEAVKAKT